VLIFWLYCRTHHLKNTTEPSMCSGDAPWFFFMISALYKSFTYLLTKILSSHLFAISILNPNYDVINDVISGFAKVVVQRCGFHHWIAQRISWGEVVSVFLSLSLIVSELWRHQWRHNDVISRFVKVVIERCGLPWQPNFGQSFWPTYSCTVWFWDRICAIVEFICDTAVH